MIDLDQLRIFQAVAEACSFTRAADIVHLTQPGISKHIKQMEGYFGLPLFDRLGKKVAPTQAGEILAEATQQIMVLAAAAEQKIDDLKGLQGGKLALGASFDLGIYVLPGVLAKFEKQYPQVEVTVEIGLGAKIMAKILANKLDLGLVSNPAHDEKLSARQFMTDELIAIVPGHHPWARKKRIRPQDLERETLLVAARGAGIRAVVEGRLKEKGIAPKQTVDFGNVEGVKRAVEAGLGVSIQPKSVVEREIRGGSLKGVALAGMDTKLGRFYISRKDKHRSNAAKAFLELLQSEVRKLV